MAEHNDFFTPKEVDEQIDALATSSSNTPMHNTREEKLLQSLQKLYMQEATYEEIALQRVQQRIVQEKQAMQRAHNTHDAQESLAYSPFSEQMKQPQRIRSHDAYGNKVTNGFAVVLFIIVLLAGSLALFSHHPGSRTGHGQSNRTGIAPLPTAEPTHLMPLPHTACLSDPGLDAICTEGYYKLVHISKTFSGPQPFTITITRLYADSLRGAIGFTVLNSQGKLPDGMRQGTYQINWVESTQDGTKLPPTVGTFYGDDSTLPYNPKNFTGMMYAPFDTSSLSSDTKELMLHLEAQLIVFTPSKTQPGMLDNTNLGTADFDVSMPLHQAYSIEPRVKKIGSGLDDVHITGLTIARSETTIMLTGQDTLDAWQGRNKKLDLRPAIVIDGVVYDEYFSLNTSPGGDVTSLTLIFPQALYEKTGSWNLRFLTLNTSGKLVNTTTFQFTNPGPA